MGHRLEARNDLGTFNHVSPGEPLVAKATVGMADYRGVPAYGVLERTALMLPTRIALRYDADSWTYADLQVDVLRCAAMLQRLGVQPKDRVGILLPNVPEYVIAANAIWRCGATVVAVNPMMVAEEVHRLMARTECRWVVTLDLLSHLVATDTNKAAENKVCTLLVSIREHLPALQQLGYLWKRRSHTGHWSLPTTEKTRWFWDEMNLTTTVPVPVSVAPATDVAYILPTGGTTGTPKAVALSHQNMVANAWQQYRWTRNSFGKETMLAVLPFFHSYGMSATVMGGAMMGASLVLHHRFNTRQVIRLIEQESPSVFHAVPAMLVAMNERLRQHPAKLESIRWVISGGAPLEPQVGTEFAQHSGALVVEGYGLSETSPVTHVGDLFGEPQYGTIGYPLPETECRIVSVAEPHDDVLPGESGELCIKGPQVMLGYWRDPEGTREALRDGWLHTGDLAICEPSGRYRIVGRKKDLIITSGFNVYPIEVENVLREHPAVQDVAVVGVPDASRGELVKAFVVLKPNERWDELSLRQHCERRLAKYKRPRLFVRQHGDLPRNFLGKVIRRELRASPTSMTANSDTKEYAR